MGNLVKQIYAACFGATLVLGAQSVYHISEHDKTAALNAELDPVYLPLTIKSALANEERASTAISLIDSDKIKDGYSGDTVKAIAKDAKGFLSSERRDLQALESDPYSLTLEERVRSDMDSASKRLLDVEKCSTPDLDTGVSPELSRSFHDLAIHIVADLGAAEVRCTALEAIYQSRAGKIEW